MTQTAPVALIEENPELGATIVDGGVRFALYSQGAQRVILCLFDEHDRHQSSHDLTQGTGHIWQTWIAGIGAGQRYGYRVYGPYQPEKGLRFNPNKLLIDPYSRRLSRDLEFHPHQLGYQGEEQQGQICSIDSAAVMPKSVVVEPLGFSHRYPRIPWPKTVIYEAHPKGLSQLWPQISPAHRGKLSALCQPEAIAHFKRLGITTIELLPIHPKASEPFIVSKALTNYWGYNNLQFFAFQNTLLDDGNPKALADVIDVLHQHGLELILDVVFNHSAEGNEHGPHYSFRGIDNLSYYRVTDNPRFYENHSGCGNSLNLNHPMVVRMVTDSLRYWVEEVGVDGFRFDLATTLGRTPHFTRHSGLLQAINQDPTLRRCKLIAEPWDLGQQGYQLGQFGGRWREWNDRFRDTLRSFWRADPDRLRPLAEVLHGSAALFDKDQRGPTASINFITSHDGFTLMDLVSYTQRHNQANGEDNRDGHSHNLSHNHGSEGPSEDADINALRLRQQKNLLACLLLSQGTPMLLAGDEAENSQQGNNNAYCQDNPIGWVNWSDSTLADWIASLTALRRRFQGLFDYDYLHHQSEPYGCHWFDEAALPLSEKQWLQPQRRQIAMRYSRAPYSLLLAINASPRVCIQTLPDNSQHRGWQLEISSHPDNELVQERIELQPHSLAVLSASLKD